MICFSYLHGGVPLTRMAEDQYPELTRTPKTAVIIIAAGGRIVEFMITLTSLPALAEALPLNMWLYRLALVHSDLPGFISSSSS